VCVTVCVLQCVAVFWQYVAVHVSPSIVVYVCNVDTVCFVVWCCVEMSCNVLQCVSQYVASAKGIHCIAVYCSVLQCVAACCSVLHRVAACCSVLHYVAYAKGIRRVAACCRVLQCVLHSVAFTKGIQCAAFAQVEREGGGESLLQRLTPCVCALQCVAVRCSMLQYVAVRCSMLQCVAVRCSVLQCVAVCCSALKGV